MSTLTALSTIFFLGGMLAGILITWSLLRITERGFEKHEAYRFEKHEAYP